MSRPLNRKCARCALLSISQSREQSCWNENKCKNTRNYYRTRDKKNQSKRRSYAVATGKVLPTQFDIIPDTYRAELVLYGKAPNKMGLVRGGVKGFKVLIYRGSSLVSESNVVTCAGMVQVDLEEAIDKALEQVKELYDIPTWGEVVWRDVSQRFLN